MADDGGRKLIDYLYPDADNKPWLRVQRTDHQDGTKTFLPFRWEGNEWLPKREGRKRVLYNLPAISKAGLKAVYLVEGEKCADALTALGIAATTTMGGGWRKSFDEGELSPLCGKMIFMLPDNDEAGRFYARTMTQELAGKAEFRIVDLPGLGEGEDVVDWLAAGNTYQRLQELARVAPILKPLPPEPEPEPEIEIDFGKPEHGDPVPDESRAEDVRRALDLEWNYDSWKDWSDAGLALKGFPGGKEIWLQWAAKSDKFNAKENEIEWRRFKPKSITVASILARVSRETLSQWGKEHAERQRKERQHDHARQAPPGGQEEAKQDQPKEESGQSKSPFQTLREVMEEQPAAFLLEGLIFERGVGFLAGESQAGKSFLEVHIGCSLAIGRPVHGRPVSKPVKVAFALYEGSTGFPDRILGWVIKHKLTEEEFKLLEANVILVKAAAPDLMDDKSTDAFIAKLKQHDPDARLIFLDTFGKASVGIDENDAKDVRQAIRNAQRIADSVGGVVIAVHHFGKDAKRGMKGSSSLRADADMVFELSRRGEQEIKLHVRKLKDGEDGFDLFFRKTAVQAINPWTGEVRGKTLALTDKEGKATFSDMLLSLVEDHPDGVSHEEAREICIDRFKMTVSAFRQAKKRLLDEGFITERDGILEVVETFE